jgi:hypothetical protein
MRVLADALGLAAIVLCLAASTKVFWLAVIAITLILW